MSPEELEQMVHSSLKPTKKTRPECPTCGEDLVLSIIVFGDVKFQAYLCDCCTQPVSVAGDIVRARGFTGEIIYYTVRLTEAEQ